VLARLGYPIELDFHSIFPEGKGDLSLLPATLTLSPQQNIGIAPFAAHEGKIYPLPLMQQVIEQLIKQYPEAHIFLFGKGKREEEVFPQWCKQYPSCVYVDSQVETMRQELILMSHLDVMLSMDSANMHLASLTATPVVSVWGATHPYAGFMGWNQDLENVIQVPLECRPCSIYGQKPCMRGDYACLNNIAPETIVERINKILSKKPI
jgi:ADP-heptose:LPS heptosyltransferase